MTVVFDWELPHPPSRTVPPGPLVIFRVPVFVAPWGRPAPSGRTPEGDDG